MYFVLLCMFCISLALLRIDEILLTLFLFDIYSNNYKVNNAFFIFILVYALVKHYINYSMDGLRKKVLRSYFEFLGYISSKVTFLIDKFIFLFSRSFKLKSDEDFISRLWFSTFLYAFSRILLYYFEKNGLFVLALTIDFVIFMLIYFLYTIEAIVSRVK